MELARTDHTLCGWSIDSDTEQPLIVVLHGIFGDDRNLFEMLADVRNLDAIVYQAASYRQFDWADISASETWTGLEQVLENYPIDRDRISLMGHHIGGRGALQLAMDRPGFFAAIAPMYPGIDVRLPYPALAVYPHFYEQAVEENHIPFPVFKKPEQPEPLTNEVERAIYGQLSLATRAENLTGLPIKMVIGESAPDAAAERLALLERLQKLGIPVTLDKVPGAMHGSRPPQFQDPEFYRWLLEPTQSADARTLCRGDHVFNTRWIQGLGQTTWGGFCSRKGQRRNQTIRCHSHGML